MKKILLGIIAISLTFISANLALRSVESSHATTFSEIKRDYQKCTDKAADDATNENEYVKFIENCETKADQARFLENLEKFEKLKTTRECEMCSFFYLERYSSEGQILHQPNYLDLSGLDLSGANLDHTSFTRANFSGVNLKGSSLRNFRCNHCDFSGANLQKSDLYKADFENSNLSGANLRGIKAYQTRFSYANLTGADFRGADLSNTFFSFANLADADFREPKHSEMNVEEAYVCNTKLPRRSSFSRTYGAVISLPEGVFNDECEELELKKSCEDSWDIVKRECG